MSGIVGTVGNDTINTFGVSAGVTGGVPGAGADTILGGAGNDNIEAGAGNDSISGEAGDDFILGTQGADTIRGGIGYDVVQYTGGPVVPVQGIVVDLPNLQVTDAWGSIDRFPDRDIESFRGTSFGDSFIGDGMVGTNRLNFRPGAGADTITSTASTHAVEADYRDLTAAIRVNTTGGAATIDGIAVETGRVHDGTGGIDTIIGKIVVRGGTGADTMLSGAVGDWFQGETGDDLLSGAGGNDTLRGVAGADTLLGGDGDDGLNGGEGIDVYSAGQGYDYIDFGPDSGTRGAYVNALTGAIIDPFGNAETMPLNEFEMIVGSALSDEFVGIASGQSLLGEFPYFFQMQGRNGADTLHGGGDFLVVADYNGDTDANGDGFGVLVDLNGQFALDGWGNRDVLVDIVAARGSLFDDVLIGNSLSNILRNSPGHDLYVGGDGRDSFITTTEPGVVVDLALNRILQDGYGEQESIYGVENVYGAIFFADELLGDGLDNVLDGRGGDDLLNGRAGHDELRGRDGHDTALGEAGADTLNGGSGNDSLDGGSGADSLVGGTGNDIYIVDDLGDVVVEEVGGGADSVMASISHVLADSVEYLRLTGTALDGTGNALANDIRGTGRANLLTGGAGADILMGIAGNDTLVGGEGADRLYGGAGADILRFSASSERGDSVMAYVGAEDGLQVSASGFAGGLAAGMNLVGAGRYSESATGAVTAPNGIGQFTFETNRQILWWDVDGQGGAARVMIARFYDATGWSGSEISVIA